MKITVLGTGAMGARMAARLLASGEHEVTVWNRTAERARPLVDAGARSASTPAAAVSQADVVISMLRDDDAARAAWLDPGTGALAAMSSGAVALECSTVTPAWARELAAAAAGRQVAVLEAPLAGSRPQAEAGTLIFFVGGDPVVLERVRPVLALLGSAVHHAGGPGAGAQLKLTVNALFAVQVAAVAELLAALRDSDLDTATAVELLAATPVAAPAAIAAARGMLQRSFGPAFPIELVVKDLGYVAADASVRGHDLPVVAAVGDIYRRAARAGLDGDNITGVIRLHETVPAGPLG